MPALSGSRPTSHPFRQALSRVRSNALLEPIPPFRRTFAAHRTISRATCISNLGRAISDGPCHRTPCAAIFDSAARAIPALRTERRDRARTTRAGITIRQGGLLSEWTPRDRSRTESPSDMSLTYFSDPREDKPVRPRGRSPTRDCITDEAANQPAPPVASPQDVASCIEALSRL